jgi:cytochrome b6-f complex iron-sulfur subunit
VLRLKEGGPGPAPAALDRREALAALGALIAFGIAAPRCACGPSGEPLKPGQVALSLDSLRPGVRTVVVVAGNPVEVVRSGDAVTARLLRCTHMGCIVRWKEAEGEYVCPCHDGRYDAAGNVLAGPPPLPLRPVAVAVSGDRVILG